MDAVALPGWLAWPGVSCAFLRVYVCSHCLRLRANRAEYTSCLARSVARLCCVGVRFDCAVMSVQRESSCACTQGHLLALFTFKMKLARGLTHTHTHTHTPTLTSILRAQICVKACVSQSACPAVRGQTGDLCSEPKCFTVAVERCSWAVQHEDSLVTIAPRFQTNWLQVR